MLSENDIEILNTIGETADMGGESIHQVIEKTDNENLKMVLKEQYKKYSDTYETIQKIMHYENVKTKKANVLAKMQAQMVSSIKTMTSDNVTSKIAEMVIQGSTMGVTEITKKLHEYTGDNLEIKTLANDLLQTLNTDIEEMKKFL